MKDGQAQECVDYIRFTMELEGAGLSDSDEKILSDILTDECSAAEAVASFIRDNGLDVSYESGYDEMENYPGTKCLVNYFNIKDKSRLRQIEHFLVNVRTAELFCRIITLYTYITVLFYKQFSRLGFRRKSFGAVNYKHDGKFETFRRVHR